MARKWYHGLGLFAGAFVCLMLVGQGCPPPTAPPDDDGDNGGDVDDGIDLDESRHNIIFSEILTDGYQSTDTCLICHSDEGTEFLSTAHWKWQGESTNIVGYEDGIHGKTDLINNFCIAIPSNEGRCTQCHAGLGWTSNSFDFSDSSKIDCLVCHADTAYYSKDKTTGGLPAASSDLQAAAISVRPPDRANCGACHFYAGGGDNVKHGDLSSDMVSPTEAMDVHMNASGLNFACQKCHTTEDHEIAGMMVHSVSEGRVACTDCHDGTSVHSEAVLNLHLATVACEACHIPAIARSKPTVVEWYWDEAGQNISPIPTDSYGKPTYDKKKGRFVWGMNVRPTLKWFNGKWNRMIIGQNDQYTTEPVVLAEPVGDVNDLSAKLYPFKKMVGRQPADANNKTMLVPHLFGTGPGPNPYWGKYDWNLALAEGAAYAGQTYSGEYEFVDTVMYLAVSHEIAPAEQALDCEDCHAGGIDFTALGFDGDPWQPSRGQ